MRIFFLVLFGQQISLIGSGLTGFAMGVWVYQRTGSVTQLSLVSLSAILPGILVSPLAGVLIDRWNRGRAMILSDTGAGIGTLAIVSLLTDGRLEVWHICLANAFISVFNGFQEPAFSAATTLLVPEQHLGRASGMTRSGEAVAQLASPVIAGVLMGIIHIQGVILIDFATFIFAVTTLMIVRIPDIEKTSVGESGKGSVLREAVYGWLYITARPGLFGLLIFFAATNFFSASVGMLVTLLVLSFASAAVLGAIMTTGGLGMLAGSLIMGVWGGPKQLILGIFGFSLLCGLSIMAAGFYTHALLLTVFAFLYFFGVPIINGCSQVIWQRKVAPDIQGRVFATRNMIALSSIPFGYLTAGPLADHVFEPLMAIGGPLAETLGRVIGTGPGRGIGLMFIIMGVFIMLATVIAYGYLPLRRVEDDLTDEIHGI